MRSTYKNTSFISSPNLALERDGGVEQTAINVSAKRIATTLASSLYIGTNASQQKEKSAHSGRRSQWNGSCMEPLSISGEIPS
jgi:hypothetical protein